MNAPPTNHFKILPLLLHTVDFYICVLIYGSWYMAHAVRVVNEEQEIHISMFETYWRFLFCAIFVWLSFVFVLDLWIFFFVQKIMYRCIYPANRPMCSKKCKHSLLSWSLLGGQWKVSMVKWEPAVQFVLLGRANPLKES